MERPFLTADLSVAAVLDAWPETIRLFTAQRMACVGCAMAPFDTLADVATIYGVRLDRFLDELNHVAQPQEGRTRDGERR